MSTQLTEPSNSNKHVIEALDQTGDTKIHWDPNNDAEVTAAEATFDALKKKGYAAFKLDANDNQGEQIRSFDPNARRIVMTPQMRGG